jgi:putative membrane-bound dehydrogenase-like protein
MRYLLSFLGFLLLVPQTIAAGQEPLRLLFLGDDGHHRPADRFAQVKSHFDARGIDLTYTDRLSDLNAETLSGYDGLIVFANQDVISPQQEQALLDFVRNGGGFVPLHCASFCFRNSEAYVDLVGGQFQRHGGQVFGTEIVASSHPITNDFGGFRSWDETYIHTLENNDREILEYRVEGDQAAGRQREPYTWVRRYGEGKVFYTAWGHDQRTWGNPGFLNLVERGIRWACGDDPAVAGPFESRKPFVMPAMTEIPDDLPPFEYLDVGSEIPNYLAGESWGKQGSPLTKMQQPLSPEESLKHYVTPVDFGIELFASEVNMGAKPIAMNWDQDGRLWVCLTIDYPNELRRPDNGNDRIVICEDTDGDFVADKFTIFADRLSIPTAVVPYRDGVIVQDGVRTLFLKDTDGDDVADLRHVLITGWQLGDTHGGVSNLRYGLDNWIWGMQGYNNSEPQFAGGSAGPFRMGFFRFRLDDANPPNVTDLEFIRSTDNNTWGLGISEEGLIFGSTANRNPSVFMPIANRYYERVRGWGPEQLGSIADTHLFAPVTDKVRQVDHHGGYTAGAGHSLYTARQYPQQWWNRTALVNGPTGHLTGVFVLQPDGAGFTSHSPGNLIASDDEWAAPIFSEVGPDGNVWAIDWYNYIIQHNPTPQGFETGRGNAYESKLRDKAHGRILRVTHGQVDADSILRLRGAAAEQWVQTLAHPTMLWRLQAQRLLVERGQRDVVDALLRLVADQSVDEIGLNVGAIHALWTLHGLGAIDDVASPVGQAVVAALRHPSAGVRRSAIQVLPATLPATAEIVQAGLTADSEPQVRLAALLALSDAAEGNRETGQTIARLATDPQVVGDRWLRDAVTSAAAMQSQHFVAAIAQTDQSIQPPTANILARVAEHVARGRDAQQIDTLLTQLAAASTDVAVPLMEGLSRGLPPQSDLRISADTESRLLELADRLPSGELGQLIAIAGRLGSEAFDSYAQKVADSVLAELEDFDLDDATRVRAAQRLVQLRPENESVVDAILETIDLQMAPQTAVRMIESLGESRSTNVGQSLVAGAPRWTPAVREGAIRLLVSRPEWTRDLIEGLQSGAINMSDLALDQRQALASHPDATIRDAATELMRTGGGLPSPNRVAVIEQYLSATKTDGDASRGRELFKEHCGKCHRHGEMGQEVGPELTGMAVHPKEELLVHILDPSRSVEGNYRSYTVLTAEGRVLTGMLAGESKTTVELIDTTAKRETIPRADIEQLSASTKSVMPEGFEAQLDVKAMTDLLEFMTTRGKYLPIDLRKIATLPTDRPMFYGGAGELLMFDDWGTKQFAGVPFSLLKPADGRIANAVMLFGPNGKVPPTLPKQVEFAVGGPVAAIHMLGGVGGWNAKTAIADGPPVMNVRLHYGDGTSEDHLLRDGVHFADYIGPFDVPQSEAAFQVQRGFQVRYLKVVPERQDVAVERVELIKVPHTSSPITMAITVESP